MLARSGFLIKGARHGDLVKNPLVAMTRDLATQVRALAGELGLTPSSRTSLRATEAATMSGRLAAFRERHGQAG